ncbi:methionine synthase reductase-like [Topomyia yanbarensis]|uniref:methionine synthase reductase-like n=1 Tax=Topomyia yanbarensis TaxID=2498891 RepID=UPI00273BD413|nr:methionine synthase reductase-like [Topomyia yanbarensis]
MNLIEQFKNTTLSLPKLPGHYVDTIRSENGLVPQDHMQCNSKQPFGTGPVYKTGILSYKVLAEGEGVKTVYEMSMKEPTNMEEYYPGDTIGILTQNLASDVDFVLDRLHFVEIADCVYEVKLAKPVKKKNPEIPSYVPKYITPRRLLTECLDFRIVPRKLFLQVLASYTSDPCEKRLLEILASKEGASFYNEFILKNELNFLHLLKILSSCRPSLAMLIEHFPRLLARPYSIANYNRGGGQIRIVFAMLNDGKVGITSTMFENKLLYAGRYDKYLYMYLRQTKPSFQYKEEDLEKNIIMIGPGTGVSPYLSFLEYRKRAKQLNKKAKLGSAILLTSCRHRERNYLFQDELQQYIQMGLLDNVYEAFSKDPDSRYKFVQDIIEDQKEQFIKMLLEDNTKLYLCGEGRTMLPRIQDMISTCLSKMQCIPKVEADALMAEYKKTGKYMYYSMIRY